jgi:hypothetical protein
MRKYGDQEDTQTSGANKNSLLSGEILKPDPGPTSEKATEEKTAVANKPKHRRPAVVAAHVEKPVATAQPVSRNSIELIEGSKRRDVDIP